MNRKQWASIVCPNVSSHYGAPMGRRDDNCVLWPDGRAYLRQLPMSGDYDAGGAYWGASRGSTLYAAMLDDDGQYLVRYVRASSRKQAAELLDLGDNVSFFNLKG